MRVREVLLCTVAATIVAPLTGARAQNNPGVGPYGQVPVVSINARPDIVVFGSPTTISGTLRSRARNVRILIQARTFSPRGTFATISQTATDRRGSYRFAPRPRVHTVYRVVTVTTPPRSSLEELVRVRMKVGVRANRSVVRAGRLVRFTGRVWPRHNGRRAYVQRRSPSGRWVTVGRPRLRAFDATSSRYVRRVRVRRTGVYRVKVNGHSDHSTGYSRLVTITAR